MNFNDVVAVIGLRNRATELAEALCNSIGIQVFYAMKKSDPSQRIDSCDEEAVISSPFEKVPETVYRCGLMAANHLDWDGTVDYNPVQDCEMFGLVLGMLIHRIKSPADVPAGWVLSDILVEPAQVGFEHQAYYSRNGHILADGKIIVDFGQGKRILQIPNDYRDIFPTMENFGL